MMIPVVGGNTMTKMTEMTIADLYVALAKVKLRLDRYIMREVEGISLDGGLNHYIDYVQVQRDCIKHIEGKIKAAQMAKLKGEVYIILRDKGLE